MASTRTPCPSLTPDASQAPSGALLVDLQERRQAMDGEFYTFEDFIRYYPKGQAYLYWNRAAPPSGAPVDGAAEHGDSSHKWDSRDITYDDSSDRPWGHRTDGSDSVDGAPGLGLQEIQERSVGATEHTLVHIMLRQEDLPELQLAHGNRRMELHDEARAWLNHMADQDTITFFDLTERWKNWKSYIATHKIAQQLVGLGIIGFTGEYIEGTQDPNRSGRMCMDMIIRHTDGGYVRIHPGSKIKTDAQPKFFRAETAAGGAAEHAGEEWNTPGPN